MHSLTRGINSDTEKYDIFVDSDVRRQKSTRYEMHLVASIANLAEEESFASTPAELLPEGMSVQLLSPSSPRGSSHR